MRNKNSLTILIPARNEESTIIKTLESLRKKVRLRCKYIIINDQSSDNTAEEVKRYIQKYKNFSLLHTTKRKNGFSYALLKGFSQADSEYVLPVMADYCDDPKTIAKMYKKIQEGYDVVAGSRYITGGGKSGGPVIQGFMPKFVCLSLQFLTDIPIHDISNSFKIYRKSFVTNLIVPQDFGVEISMYLTLQAYFKGGKVTEVPTYWYGRTTGKSKFNIFKRLPRYVSIYVWALQERFLQLVRQRTHGVTFLNK